MSKKHGHRKKRRKQIKRRNLLGNVAAAMNACERAGVALRAQHGAVWSEYGVVLPPYEKGTQWDVRRFKPR